MEKNRGPLSTELALHAIRGKKAYGKPGETYHYSNTNYHLAALILEKVYKKSLATLFQEKLFAVISLKKTFYGMSELPCDDIHGYGSPWRPWNDTYTWKENTGPDGGIFASALDLEKWIRALFSPAGQFVKYGEQMMANPVVEAERKRQGMGVEILLSRKGKKIVGHTGGLDGYLSAAFYIPSSDAVVVLYVNRSKEKQFSKTLGSILRCLMASPQSDKQS